MALHLTAWDPWVTVAPEARINSGLAGRVEHERSF
jgi:hypothetical protein